MVTIERLLFAASARQDPASGAVDPRQPEHEGGWSSRRRARRRNILLPICSHAIRSRSQAGFACRNRRWSLRQVRSNAARTRAKAWFTYRTRSSSAPALRRPPGRSPHGRPGGVPSQRRHYKGTRSKTGMSNLIRWDASPKRPGPQCDALTSTAHDYAAQAIVDGRRHYWSDGTPLLARKLLSSRRPRPRLRFDQICAHTTRPCLHYFADP